jgi:hypothetical protein
MPVTAEYDLSLELKHLAATINASAMWRALVATPNSDWTALKAVADLGTSSESAALARIHLDRFDPAGDVESWPFAVIRHLTDSDIERYGTTGWDTTGQLMWFLEIPRPTAYASSLADFAQYARNVIGRILHEMRTAVETDPAGRLNITRIGRGPMGEVDPDDNNGVSVWSVDFVVHHMG